MQVDDVPNAEVDVEAVAIEGGEPNETPEVVNPTPEEPFLVVDDRTVFKTREEAIHASHEAGQRIAQLAPYEKTLGKYGITDPRAVSGLLDELIAFRQAKDAAAKAPKTEPKAEAATLTKEDKEIREYLKKVAPELGFVSKDALEALKAELDELKQGSASSQEVRTQSLIEDGESKIGSYLSAAKIDDADGSRMKVVGTLIKSWIESDPSGELTERFFRGGRSLEAVVKEGYDQAMKTLGWQAPVDTTKPNAAATYAQNKGKQVVVNKKLPAEGSATKGPAAIKPRQNPGKPDHIRDLGEKAWEEFQANLK